MFVFKMLYSVKAVLLCKLLLMVTKRYMDTIIISNLNWLMGFLMLLVDVHINMWDNAHFCRLNKGPSINGSKCCQLFCILAWAQ